MDCWIRKVNGEVTMEKPLEYMLSMLRNGEYTLSIKRKQKPRSINQNSLMWLWFTYMEDQFGQAKEDFHDYYCKKFLRRRVTMPNGEEEVVVGRTSTLTTAQFTEFLNKVQADVAVEHGFTLPLPSDLYYEQFVDEYRHRI